MKVALLNEDAYIFHIASSMKKIAYLKKRATNLKKEAYIVAAPNLKEFNHFSLT